MAMTNPTGRVNYEPNSWGVGPRESKEKGFKSFHAKEEGIKQKIRPESFADHYSQARQFFISQTDVEQRHMVNALVFELSKVEKQDIRVRLVSHLLNIDQTLAEDVAKGLRIMEMPAPADAARPTRNDLEPSAALSILKNGPENFAGRNVGVLVTDGVDIKLLNNLLDSIREEGASATIVAPHVGGIKASDGKIYKANEKIDGGPSVLFDAVALMLSPEGADQLGNNPVARDFIADAIAHQKFIAHTEPATALVNAVGINDSDKSQLVLIDNEESIKTFLSKCSNLRDWDLAPMKESKR